MQREALGLDKSTVFGACFKHPNFNMVNCPACANEASQFKQQPLHGEEVNSDRLSVIIKGLRASVKNLSDNGISDLSIRAVEHWQNELDKFIQQTQPSKEVTDGEEKFPVWVNGDNELDKEAKQLLLKYAEEESDTVWTCDAIHAIKEAAQLHCNDGLNQLIEWMGKLLEEAGEKETLRKEVFAIKSILAKAKEIQ